MRFLSPTQDSKNVPSSRPGQLDFPVGQEHFHSHLHNGQGPDKSSANQIKKKYAKNFPGQAKFKSCFSEGEAGIRTLKTSS